MKLNVPDMTCGHCASVIEKAVKSVDPAASVTVDLAAKLVTVKTDATPGAVSAAVDAAGYANRAA